MTIHAIAKTKIKAPGFARAETSKMLSKKPKNNPIGSNR
jgi:hypothetical protein